jgi:hypothetical protein
MSIDPAMKRVVQRIARTDEARFVGANGAIDKRALSAPLEHRQRSRSCYGT